MKKIIVQHRSSHHSGYSGYAQLINFLQDVEVVSGHSFLSEGLARFIKNNVNTKYGVYDSNSVHKNFELSKKLLFSKEKYLVHYLNGERDIRQAIRWFPNKTLNVATFHKPEDFLKRKITNTRYLQRLDGAIAVGSNQVDFLKEWLNNENVVYIPHGVDTTFFKPDFSKRKENSILFVGQHLRDFEALNYTIPRLIDKIPTIKINIVLKKEFQKMVTSFASNVHVFSGVNDEKLREMYQSATLLFLPLKDVTACNSILEAMACGLPIITSDLEGNRGYGLNETNSFLVSKNDYEALVDKVLTLLKNETQINNFSNNLVLNVQQFEWQKITKQIKEFYDFLK